LDASFAYDPDEFEAAFALAAATQEAADKKTEQHATSKVNDTKGQKYGASTGETTREYKGEIKGGTAEEAKFRFHTDTGKARGGDVATSDGAETKKGDPMVVKSAARFDPNRRCPYLLAGDWVRFVADDDEVPIHPSPCPPFQMGGIRICLVGIVHIRL
jgi:hypothetical protein